VNSLLADLHIHTCLSPCSELEMLPELIIAKAQELGVDVIGITDHNSAENVQAVVNASKHTTVHVLPGIEVQTREEVHVITLFDTVEQALSWQEIVYAHLPSLKNNARLFGQQIVLDGNGDPVGYLDRLLITATSLSVEDVLGIVKDIGGIGIPAHVDRQSFSLIANLGFIPEEMDILAVEISAHMGPYEAWKRFRQLESYTLVSNSDAHRLDDLAPRMSLAVQDPTVAELQLACAGVDGRSVQLEGICTNPSFLTTSLFAGYS